MPSQDAARRPSATDEDRRMPPVDAPAAVVVKPVAVVPQGNRVKKEVTNGAKVESMGSRRFGLGRLRMDRVGALGEAVVFLDRFKDLPDPRQHG
jgi:hypothetical protein